MILEIDSGNTRLKWRLNCEGKIVDCGSFVHGMDSLGALENLIRSAEKVRLANVGPKEVVALIESACKESAIPLFVAVASAGSGGVISCYDKPSSLGVDRWLAMIAGYHLSEDACCVIDCGSAITVDVVAADGHHLGGYIVPGLQLLLKTLREDTRQVVFSDRHHSIGVALGDNTQTAVNHGVMSLVTEWLNKLISNFQKMFDNEITFYLTGGDGNLIMSYLEQQPIYVADLVLQGLAIIDDRG